MIINFKEQQLRTKQKILANTMKQIAVHMQQLSNQLKDPDVAKMFKPSLVAPLFLAQPSIVAFQWSEAAKLMNIHHIKENK